MQFETADYKQDWESQKSFYDEFCHENEGFWSVDKRRQHILMYQCPEISFLKNGNMSDQEIVLYKAKFQDYCRIRRNLFLSQIKPFLKQDLYQQFKFQRNEIGYLANNCMIYHQSLGTKEIENSIYGFVNNMNDFLKNNKQNNQNKEKEYSYSNSCQYYILYNGILAMFSHLWLVAMRSQNQKSYWHGFDTFWFDQCSKNNKNNKNNNKNSNKMFVDAFIDYLLHHIAQTVMFGPYFLDFNQYDEESTFLNIKNKLFNFEKDKQLNEISLLAKYCVQDINDASIYGDNNESGIKFFIINRLTYVIFMHLFGSNANVPKFNGQSFNGLIKLFEFFWDFSIYNLLYPSMGLKSWITEYQSFYIMLLQNVTKNEKFFKRFNDKFLLNCLYFSNSRGHGGTILHSATMNCFGIYVKLLLNMGFDCEKKNHLKITPYFSANTNNYTNIVGYFDIAVKY